MLTITHTHAEGTLISGTSRGDGSSDVLKANGWRWGRSISTWFVPMSRDRLPKNHIINRTATALRAAGFEVETEIDTTARPTEEVEAGKIERQADRVAALDAKATRKEAASTAADARAQRDGDALPWGGEPIKIGHHSENRHRRAIDRAHNSMRKSIDADEEAREAARRVEVAAHTTDSRYAPVTVANRIKKLGAEIRKLNRQIEEDAYDSEHGYIPATAEQKAARARRNAPQIAEKTDQLTYWEGIRASQIASGQITDYSRENITKGDEVRVLGTWRTVVRANAKTVSVTTGYSWTDTVPYAEIKDHRTSAPVDA